MIRQFVSLSTLALATMASGARAQDAVGKAGESGISTPAPPEAEQARAPDAGPADGQGISDIVVTAQRRSESVQRAALSIAVISGAALSERGVIQPDQLTRLTPGVQVGGGSTTQIYIRGVGDFGVVATANPAVATSLDGVGISRPQAISGNFFDLERVEILKGPQGTLYGRNASGGAVNLIAVQPRLGEFSGYLNGGYGNYNAFQGEGAVNVPVGDSAALRLSAQIADRDGYLTDGTDDDKHQAVRLQGLVEAGPLTVHLLTSYTHLGGVGSGLAVIPAIAGQSAWTGSASPVASDYFLAVAQANFTASGGTSVPPAYLDGTDATRPFQNIRSWNAQVQIDYDLGGATLSIIPAYRFTHARFNIVPNFSYAPGGDGTDGERSDQYSLEARLGNDGTDLKWVVGGFLFREDQDTDFMVNSGLIQRFHILSRLGTRSYALFGQATYGLTDRFRLTAGMRFTSDKRSLSDFRKYAVSPTVTGYPGPLAAPCIPDAGFPAGSECSLLPDTSFDSTRTFDKVTWRAGFEYDVGPQSMLFANVATGFKAGGFNQAIDPADTARVLSFRPETITAYTVGLRNRLLGNMLQVNLEGFYWDYKDLQLTRLILDGSGNLALTTQNAGKARIYGLDVDVVARPTQHLTLRAAIEYVNSKYLDFTFVQAAAVTAPGSTGCTVSSSDLPASALGPFVSIDCSGFPLVRSPKWSGNAGATQVFDLANGGNLTLDADVSLASARYVSTSFVANARVRGYGNASASLTYNAPEGRWFLGGYVRNITNARVYTGGGGDQSIFVPGFVTSTIGAPRTYGMRAGIRF